MFDQSSNNGVIIEIKHNERIEGALKQIDTKSYDTVEFEKIDGKVNRVIRLIRVGFNLSS